MTDIERAKYVNIMAEIEDLEEQVENFERANASGGRLARMEFEDLRDRLAERMRELARITDGCTRPGAAGT